MTFTDPPRSPEPAGLVPAIGVLCILAGVVLVVAYCGCDHHEHLPSKPSYCYDEDDFGDELTKCVKRAASKAESKACRKSVHETCGITWTEAAYDAGR